MGITQKSLDRLVNYIGNGDVMLELGAQNMYDNNHYGQIAGDVFKAKGIVHYSIDIIEHQGAEKVDLREPYDFTPNGMKAAIVTNYGTLEHVDGSLYQPLLNIHNAGYERAFMVHENPKTGNWPGHGQHYFTKEFWIELSKASNYELLEVSEEPAMGNDVDGWNICAVLRKTTDSKFISEEQFNNIYNHHIKQS
jgi:hypothetical protein